MFARKSRLFVFVAGKFGWEELDSLGDDGRSRISETVRVDLYSKA